MNSSHILKIRSLSYMCITNIIFQFVSSLLISQCFFQTENFFFILTKSNLSVVSFTAVFSMFYLRDLCLPQGHEDFLPLFLPKFIVLAVMFRSVPSTSASLTTLQPLDMWTTQTIENSQRDGNTRPPYLPPEIPVCWSRSTI